MEEFVKAIRKTTNIEYKSSGKILATQEYILDESGIFNLADDLKAVHFSVPSGVFKGSDLYKVGTLAQKVGGKIRLSVEQSLYIITDNENSKVVQNSDLFKEYKEYNNTYFNHQIACAGTATCSFGVIPNKPDAIEMANFLQKEVPIKRGKVRMYWSGCVKGCGIHGIADIGFEGCKAKDEEGKSCYGVHIYLGGKATQKSKEARVIAKAIPLYDAKYIIKDLMLKYKNERLKDESFESYDNRVLSKLEVEDIIS